MKKATVFGGVVVAAGIGLLSVGQLPLRGIVSKTQTITFPGTPLGTAAGRALVVIPRGASAGVVRLRLGNLANIASVVKVTIKSDSATGSGGPVLSAEDGTSVPYRISVGGRNIAFSGGEADVAMVTIGYQEDPDGTEFKIITPSIPGAGTKSFRDHLILVAMVP